MKVLVLDGSETGDTTGARVHGALLAQLEARGWDAESVILREQKIGSCAGCFGCWTRTPGTCIVNDDNRDIAQAMMRCDVMIFLTPLHFGAYGSILKGAVDHLIQNISPFFASIAGETHHQKRYTRYPSLMVLGWLNAPDGEAETLFHHLAARNAINIHAPSATSHVMYASDDTAQINMALDTAFNALQSPRTTHIPVLPTFTQAVALPVQVKRALLLVGSPRTRNSTSGALGSYLRDQLNVANVTTETIYLHTVVNSPAKLHATVDAFDNADLVVLAFPVYVDALPAPAMRLLEHIAAHRRANPPAKAQRFAAIGNCGFPEAAHNAPALAICACFAQQAGLEWAGGLALGGGGIVAGEPLDSAGGKAEPLRAALTMAAQALARGEAIPQSAADMLAKPIIPAWLYRTFGSLGWHIEARRYKTGRMLRRQPYPHN
jgi:multimeric flavodoxin WrbA